MLANACKTYKGEVSNKHNTLHLYTIESTCTHAEDMISYIKLMLLYMGMTETEFEIMHIIMINLTQETTNQLWLVGACQTLRHNVLN